MSKTQLLEAYVDVQSALKASESWEQSYRDSPATFKRLVRQEAELQAAAVEYLVGLSGRVSSIVNWSEVKLAPVQAAAVPPENDERFKAEMALLSAVVSTYILEMTTIGAQAGEHLYKRPIGITSLDDFILDSAERHTAQLVSQVTGTTRRLIQRSIKRSIAEGRDFASTLDLLKETVSNPVRAEMIASTESVNAYQDGLSRFAEQTGAKTKTWDALSGACQLCSPLDGETIRRDKQFTLPNGVQVEKPAAHPRCRCGCIYNY
ncbi:MAG: hypothetical protein WA991_03900 [Ornithinimicrobium sp.]